MQPIKNIDGKATNQERKQRNMRYQAHCYFIKMPTHSSETARQNS